jgi:hypothetical protein
MIYKTLVLDNACTVQVEGSDAESCEAYLDTYGKSWLATCNIGVYRQEDSIIMSATSRTRTPAPC